MDLQPDFLADLVPRPLTAPQAAGLRPVGLHVGQGQSALEVAVFAVSARPAAGALQAAWRGRRGGRASPVLLVALYQDRAALAGPSGDDPPVRLDIDRGQAERLCRAALEQPDRHAALAFLGQALPSLDTEIPGLRNEGLFALHALAHDAPRRPEWHVAAGKAGAVATRRGQDLLAGLGFRVERLDNLTLLLRGGERRAALAVLLDPAESPEAGAARFNSISPISYALTKADTEGLSWVMVLLGDRIRLYPTALGAGVGRRGRAETYVELQTSILAERHLGFLWLLFSADALAPAGSVAALLEASQRFAGDLAVRLRERIYRDVVPKLARAIADVRCLASPSADDLALTYRMALTTLFRLLFIAYAEDRDLLPYRSNEAYRRRSLKQKAQELADAKRKLIAPGEGANHWQEVARLFRAVQVGNPEWGVPAHDGGLFSADAHVSPVGAGIAGIALPDAAFAPALEHLLLIETPEGPLGPVDFRSLGVGEFGTIYEGLLESELSVADVDLAIDAKGNYLPRKGHQPVEVAKGAVYLHDRSGARKWSGSYFTKSFAVEHLLDRALEPALDEHLRRLDGLIEADAAEALFDFRVADIAMGSGHFLVGAIDRIEKRLADYLNRRPLPAVRRELAELRVAAERALGEEAGAPIEDMQLLRRLIARRCIYGVDLNALAVELARLSIWIHSFVPGLPLTMLAHNLVRGNALVGIGTVAEIQRRFERDATSLFPVDAENLLGPARQPLLRLARIADASLKDIEAARTAMEEARIAIGPTKALCDIIAAEALDPEIRFQPEEWGKEWMRVERSPALKRARVAFEGLSPLHFPIAFPEVFLRRRSGFDVILGNPPWEKVHVEEHVYWARQFPGIRGLSQRDYEREERRLRTERPDLVAEFEREVQVNDRLREVLVSSQMYPGIGTGHPDLYKAFCWRFWNLSAAEGGRIGVVLPRSALAAKGSEEFRRAVFAGAADVDLTLLLNNRQWFFPEVHPQYTIGLCAIARGEPKGETIALSGPFATRDRFNEGHNQDGARFTPAEVISWNDTASLPLLPSEHSVEVFTQLRKAPRLDLNDGRSWRARPEQELNATTQKDMFDLRSKECPRGFWPVFKGESFDVWAPDTGEYYAFADPEKVLPWLYEKRLRSGKSRAGGVHAEFPAAYRQDKGTLACWQARIAFRDVSRATDSRTVRACLLPPRVLVVHNAPVVHWPRGDGRDRAFLLGVLCSIPLDWYARRFVETHVQFFLFDALPVPRPLRGDARWRRVVSLAGRLASPDKRFASWAKAVAVACGKLPEDEKQDMIAELDAVVARLYGLTEKQLVHIFETFHEGWNYETRLKVVLRYFREHAAEG